MGAPVVISAAVILALGGAAYVFARYLDGRIRLELTRDTVDSGQDLDGRVTIEARRPIRGLLRVSLVGREKRRRRRSGESERVEWVEVYRQDQVVEESREFPAGVRETHAFQLLAPTRVEARRGGSVDHVAEQTGDTVMSSVLRVAARAADALHGRIYWHVEARLEADGIDLSTKRKIDIDLRD